MAVVLPVEAGAEPKPVAFKEDVFRSSRILDVQHFA
jgi:hypothetical protein